MERGRTLSYNSELKKSQQEDDSELGRLNRFSFNGTQKRSSSIQLDNVTFRTRSRSSLLLQQTLDHNYKSNLTRSFSNQQLSQDPTMEIRPQNTRSISYNSIERPVRSQVEAENLKFLDSKHDKSKSLPIRKQRDEVTNKKHIYSNTENSIKNLQPSSSTSNLSLGNGYQSSKSPLIEIGTGKVFNKMSKMVDNAAVQVSSFLGSSQHPRKVSKQGSLKQIEDDSSDEGEDENGRKSPEEDPSSNFSLDQDSRDEYPMSDDIRTMFQEMEHYQQHINNKHYNSEPLKMNRTTQKLNDYKNLTLDSPKTESFQFLNTYKIKIQYETIVSQYTSIRCRFPSKVSSSKTSGKSKTNTGVMGYLNRYNQESKKLTKQPPKFFLEQSHDMSQSTKDMYLQSMWNEELRIFSNPEQEKQPLNIAELAKTVIIK